MRRRKVVAPVPPPPWEGHCTLGALEQFAGITDRAAFWMPFAKIADSRESVDAGVRELKRLAAERASLAVATEGA